MILTGLWGSVCYRMVPGWLQSMEPGSPLMADDLTLRRQELDRDIATALAGATDDARKMMESAIVRLSSTGFLLRQFRRREALEIGAPALVYARWIAKVLLVEAFEKVGVTAVERCGFKHRKTGKAKRVV